MALGTALLMLLSAACTESSKSPQGAARGLLRKWDDGRLSSAQDELLGGSQRPYFHDFGLVPDGEKPTHRMLLVNSDPLPMEIKRLDPSCGCVHPQLSALGADGALVRANLLGDGSLLSLPSGATLVLDVQLDTNAIPTKNVDKLVSVRLTTSSPARAYLTIEYHLIADQPFQLSPAYLDLGRIARSAGGRGKLEVLPIGPRGERIEGLGPLPPGVWANLQEQQRLGRTLWVLEAGFEPPLEQDGRRTVQLELATVLPDQGPGHPLTVQLTAFVVADQEFDPPQLVLRGPLGSAAQARCTLQSLLPGERLRVLSSRLEGPRQQELALQCAAVDPDPQGRSARWELRLSALPAAQGGPHTGKLVLELDDPQNPRLECTYVVQLQ